MSLINFGKLPRQIMSLFYDRIKSAHKLPFAFSISTREISSSKCARNWLLCGKSELATRPFPVAPFSIRRGKGIRRSAVPSATPLLPSPAPQRPSRTLTTPLHPAGLLIVLVAVVHRRKNSRVDFLPLGSSRNSSPPVPKKSREREMACKTAEPSSFAVHRSLAMQHLFPFDRRQTLVANGLGD